jgi:hypothetical protein
LPSQQIAGMNHKKAMEQVEKALTQATKMQQESHYISNKKILEPIPKNP